MKPLISRVRETISRYDMIHRDDTVVVAVSGGPDSVCLLDTLCHLKEEYSITLVVAHYEHGLRPTEDPFETTFVHRLAESVKLPFETDKASLSFVGNRSSVEETARNARFDFLERVRDKYGAQRIALGHTLNDQAETILMRLLRGSGPAGLASIPPVRNHTIIRPLIEVERKQIEDYLESRQLKWVTDSSNLQATHVRNKIRLELMPLLEKAQPQIVKLMGQAAKILRSEDDYLEQIADAWVMKEATSQADGSLLVSISSFLSAPPALRNRVTRRLIRKAKSDLRRISMRHIESVSRLANGKRSQAILNFPDGLCVERIYNRLCFRAGSKRKWPGFYYEVSSPGEFPIEQIGKRITLVEIERGENLNLDSSAWTVYLDAGKMTYPLVVRNVIAGDRFIPLGMKGHKKIKNYFVDLKVPLEVRHRAPLLLSDGIPVWIGGFRLDDRFKVTLETTKILRVTLSPLIGP